MPLRFTDTSFLPRSLTASFDGVSTKGILTTGSLGPTYDADALAYFARVEGVNGDNQALETAVKDAINNFIVGCKADGIWNAIKASCILAGARTLSGALRPLVGTAPPTSTSSLATTTARRGWWEMEARSIWTAIGITMLTHKIVSIYAFLLAWLSLIFLATWGLGIAPDRQRLD